MAPGFPLSPALPFAAFPSVFFSPLVAVEAPPFAVLAPALGAVDGGALFVVAVAGALDGAPVVGGAGVDVFAGAAAVFAGAAAAAFAGAGAAVAAAFAGAGAAAAGAFVAAALAGGAASVCAYELASLEASSLLSAPSASSSLAASSGF